MMIWISILILLLISPSLPLTFEEASKNGPKMLSTTIRPYAQSQVTPIPELELNDTSLNDESSVKDEAEARQENIKALMGISSRLEEMKNIADMVRNSNIPRTIENRLEFFLDMMSVLEYHYGFPDLSSTCAQQYFKAKNGTLNEFDVLFEFCKSTVDNMDVSGNHEISQQEKSILKNCARKLRTVPTTMMGLMEQTIHASLMCAVNDVTHLLMKMDSSDLMKHINENSLLHIQEVLKVITAYEKLLNQKQIQVFLESDVRKILNTSLAEVVSLKKVLKSVGIKKSLQTFSGFVKLIADYDTEKSDEFLKLISTLESEFQQGMLQINMTQWSNGSLKDLEYSTPIYKVVHLNNLVREILGRLTMNDTVLPVKMLNKPKNLKTMELFTGKSATFGKPCENSPHHLVGTCSDNNHEMCRHVTLDWGADVEHQDFLQTNDLAEGNELKKLKHCTCGFRTDCDSALGKGKSTCFLVPNADGQCRGGEGYPCYTRPLEPLMFDESCITGFCNRVLNRCEFDGDQTEGRAGIQEKAMQKWRHLMKKLREIFRYYFYKSA